MKKIYRYKWRILVLFVISFASWALWPARFTRTISYETTRITTPIDDEGYLDYETALNELVKGDIKPEENAMVLLVQAFGPKPEGTNLPPDFYRRLEIEEPPENGTYLKAFSMPDPENPEKILQRLPTGFMKPWAKKDFPEVAAWVKANEIPLKVVNNSLERPGYYHPLVSITKGKERKNLLNAFVPFVQRFHLVTLLLTTRAMNAIHEERYNDAWADFAAIHRLGHMITQNSGRTLEAQLGYTIQITALHGYDAILSRKLPNLKQIEHIRSLTGQLPTRPELGRIIRDYERLIILDAIQDSMYTGSRNDLTMLLGIKVGDERANFPTRMLLKSVNYDLAFRRLNERFDQIADAVEIDEIPDFTQAMESIKQDISKSGSPNPGFFHNASIQEQNRMDSLMSYIIYDYQEVKETQFLIMIKTRIKVIAIALIEYSIRQGNYPESLEKLGLPAELLTDHFNGKQFHYEKWKNGFILCSLGLDQKWEFDLDDVRDAETDLNDLEPGFRSLIMRITAKPAN